MLAAVGTQGGKAELKTEKTIEKVTGKTKPVQNNSKIL